MPELKNNSFNIYVYYTMRTTLILFLLAILMSCQFRQDGKNLNFSIEGYVDTLYNNKKVFLFSQEGSSHRKIDSTKITNGKFLFKGSIKRPKVYGIAIESIDNILGLFMENSPIFIDVDTKKIEKSKVSGSSTHDQFVNYIDSSTKITSRMNLLYPVFQKARAEDDIQKLEEINFKMKEIINENTEFALQYAEQHPDSYVAAYALFSVMQMDLISRDTLFRIYNNFTPYVKKGDFAMDILLNLQDSIPQPNHQLK